MALVAFLAVVFLAGLAAAFATPALVAAFFAGDAFVAVFVVEDLPTLPSFVAALFEASPFLAVLVVLLVVVRVAGFAAAAVVF